MKYIFFTTGEKKSKTPGSVESNDEVSIALIDADFSSRWEQVDTMYGKKFPVIEGITVMRALKKVKPSEYLILSDGTPPTLEYVEAATKMGFDFIDTGEQKEEEEQDLPNENIDPIAEVFPTVHAALLETANRQIEMKRENDTLKRKQAEHDAELQTMEDIHKREMKAFEDKSAEELQKVKDAVEEILNEGE